MKKCKSLFFILCASLMLSSASFAFAEETTPPTTESTAPTETKAPISESTNESESNSETSENTTAENIESSVQETEAPINLETEPESQTKIESMPLKARKAPAINENAYENKQVFQFVKRMYEIVLQREPDSKGLDDWYNSLVTGKNTGADIVNGFFFSDEFSNLNLNDKEYIQRLYRALFNREADSSGLAYWLGASESGVSRRFICRGFIGSIEYGKMCSSYGIVPGSMDIYENRDKNYNITRFVNHFYNYCLGRKADSQGLNHWTGGLLGHSLDGVSIVNGFIFSDEFQGKNLSNEEFVEILYRTLLSRPSDPAGKANWVEYLEKGVSKQYILIGFVYSSEFSQLCSTYGIVRGDMASNEPRDINPDLTAYMQYLYLSCFGKNATVEELNERTNDILNNGAIAEDVIPTFFNSPSYINKSEDNTTFIKDLYQILLNRKPSTSDLDSWLSILKTKTRDDIIKGFVHSNEYIKICQKVGLPTIRNGWSLENDRFYYYKNGKKKTGWITENGQRYYLNPANNGARETGWEYVDGYKLYFNNDGQLVQDVDYLIGHQDSYFIKVYKWSNYLIVFAKDGNNGYTIPVKAMITSCGNGTPTGDYWTPNKFRWLTMVGGSKAQWCTQIVDSYLFHSVPYRIADNSTLYTDLMYNFLGTTQSMGCIRLRAGDAKWIYDNCSLGTHVNIDPNVNEGPFDKPVFEPIPSWHTWDPTDPTARYLCQQHGCH